MLLVAILATLVLAGAPALAQESSEPVWLQNLSDRDAQCVTDVFGRYNITPVNVAMIPGGDGSPSPTLSLVGQLSAGTVVEFDRYEGRMMTIRGGETGQIVPSQQAVVIAILSDNALRFASFWSDTSRGVVQQGGDPLESIVTVVRTGTATEITFEVWREDVEVARITGNMNPLEGVGTVFRRIETITGIDNGTWQAGNLRGVGVPTELLQGDCYHIVIRANVPQQAILEIGIGAYQIRASEVGEIETPANTPTNTPMSTPTVAPTNMPTSTPTNTLTATPTGTPVPSAVVGTVIPTFVPTCPAGEIPVFGAGGDFLQCLAFQG